MPKALSTEEHLIRRAVIDLARDANWMLHRAFETEGCSCTPLRKQVQELKEQAKEEELAWKEQNPLFQEIQRLEDEIVATDMAEHPALNNQGSLGSPFFRVWVYQNLDSLADFKDPTALAQAYARAWYGGWRPRRPAPEGG